MSKKRRGVPTPPSPARRPAVRRSARPDWLLPAVLVSVALAVIFVALVLYSRFGPSPAPAATPPSTAASGQTVDGVQCQTQEQVLFHIHAHLAIFANGQPRTVPLGIGIPSPQIDSSTGTPFVVGGSCFYWLHSHATDGVIHVESPVQRAYTLGNWFDIWGQPLSASQVAGDSGTVIAYVNGQRYDGDPRQIPLTPHAVIQLDVGTDVAPRAYTFPSGY